MTVSVSHFIFMSVWMFQYYSQMHLMIVINVSHLFQECCQSFKTVITVINSYTHTLILSQNLMGGKA